MTLELSLLMFAVMLGFLHILFSAHATSRQRGYRWTASARDDPMPPLSGVAGRLERALRNFLETFPFFAALVLTAHVLNVHDALTRWGAVLYFAGRLVYLPLYAAGVPLVRSLAWNVAAVGLLLLIVALLR